MNEYTVIYKEGDKINLESYLKGKEKVIRRLWANGEGVTYIVDTGSGVKMVIRSEDKITEVTLDYCEFGDLIEAALIWRAEGNVISNFTIYKSDEIGEF
jgi:hypothetical protein